METVSVSDLKARLSRYLRIVRRGGEVQILDRGVPIAKITPIPQDPAGESAPSRERLIAAGLVRAGRGGAGKVLEAPPLDLPTTLSPAVDADRDDRFR